MLQSFKSSKGDEIWWTSSFSFSSTFSRPPPNNYWVLFSMGRKLKEQRKKWNFPFLLFFLASSIVLFFVVSPFWTFAWQNGQKISIKTDIRERALFLSILPTQILLSLGNHFEASVQLNLICDYCCYFKVLNLYITNSHGMHILCIYLNKN
jgi:hypothetical protein